MSKKKYISLTGIQYTFPVKVTKDGKEKAVWVSFKGNENDYVTADEDVQNAIEATDKFKKKQIGLSGKIVVDAAEKTVATGSKYESATFEDVTDINGAVEVLNAAPYKIAKSKLKTPDQIKAAMESCNVSFPNLEL